jgi:lipoyl(octanoyl) transferase
MNDTLRICHIKEFSSPQPYTPIWEAMREHIKGKPEHDEIWLLEHEPVYTQGQAGLDEHILQHNNIPIIHSDRGGQITYHGPGQLMVYTLINLRAVNIGIRSMVTLLENCVIELLAQHNIAAYSKKDAPGVYVDGKKIASLGLRVRHGYCYHGLALNVAMDLAPFQAINPCGYQNLEVTQIQDILPNLTMEYIKKHITNYFAQQFNYTPMYASKISSLTKNN